MKSIAFVSVGLAGSVAFAAEEKNATLPLREVVLYSSGVGYFERAGEVDGNGSVELRFRTEDINDLLKSMVVQDRRGSVGVISYDSRDPINRTLQSFAIDLTENPSMHDLLNQIRGEKVTVLWPNEVTGTILGVERRVVEEKDDKKREEHFLNVFSRGNLQSIPLSQVREIQLQNQKLQKELDEALAILAKGRDNEKKTVTLTFTGEGKREVNVAYLVEAPVWKTSYRLVLEEEGGFLQGWAIVENTGDDDWENVRLSLVSGRPISFKMDLYQPLYAPRPLVEPELYLSLRPQVYQDNLQAAKLESLPREMAEAFDGRAVAGAIAAPRAQNNLEYYGRPALGKALALADAAKAGGAAAGSVTGELFQYVLKMPVSIQRQKSAMLPILTEKIEGSRLSIYNENVQAKHPLNGYRLKNTSDLHLMQGPVTVFDDGSYAGDARIEDLAPGQDRLISYAIDLKTEVEPRAKSEPETLVSVRIQRGTLFTQRRQVEEKSYTVRNRDSKKRIILIEHPVRSDWQLESPAEPAERARDVYRFQLEVDAGKTGSLVVRESRQRQESVFVADIAPDAYVLYLQSSKVSERVKDVLRKVADFRGEMEQLQVERQLREERLKEIGEEQGRIRENMARLNQNAELYQRYVKKFDEQETEFERLRAEANALKEKEAARRQEFSDYLSTLDLN